MPPKKRYLNAEYENPRAQGNEPGNRMWIKATVKRGRKPQPPTVTWFATRANQADDDLYVEDPTFEVPQGQDRSDTRWACVTLPMVTGVRWSFEVVRHKQNKDDKTIPIPDVYETWRRIFLDVHADDAELYALYQRAMPQIQRAFAAACIEVVPNRAWVGGAPRRGHTTDNSVKQGRRQGERYELTMQHPQVDSVDKTLTFYVENGATNCSPVTVHGNMLHLTLGASGRWSTDNWLKGIRIVANGAELVSIKYWGNADGTEVDRDVVAAAMRGTVSTRQSDRVVHFQLDAAPLSNRWDPRARTWSTPRQTTVAQAVGAGRVTFELDLLWKVTGGTGGQQVNPGRFDTYIDRGVNALATVLCHEFGHACGLVRAQSVRRHDAARVRHASNVAARGPVNAGVDNQRYYTADYGGSGTHCNLGAVEVPSCITRSGQTYERDAPHQLCIMYHASSVDDDDTPRNNDITFCDRCIAQLRGR